MTERELLRQTLEAIDTGRSEPLFIIRDAIRNWLDDNPRPEPPLHGYVEGVKAAAKAAAKDALERALTPKEPRP